MPFFDTKFVFSFGKASATWARGRDGWRYCCTLLGRGLHFDVLGERDPSQNIHGSNGRGGFLSKVFFTLDEDGQENDFLLC